MEDLERYIEEHITPEHPVLYELRRQTHLKVVQSRMVSGHAQGNLLRMFTEMTGTGKILELGTFTGYSAITMGLGLPEGGVLHTVDRNDELTGFVEGFIEKAGLTGKVIQHVGKALELIPEKFRNEKFDLIFIDADKREYPDYYRMLMAPENGLVRKGTVILADNTLWYGKVLDSEATDKQTAGIRQFNEMIKQDAEQGRVDCTILPLRDGLTVIRVK